MDDKENTNKTDNREIRKVTRRGYEPSDQVEFGPKWMERLNRAGEELLYLLNRGYDIKPASTFVGNHYLLSERQRLALVRAVSTDEAVALRKQKEVSGEPEIPCLWIDGFNLIITLEVALSGSFLLEGRDGTIRDLAGLRGTYRIVDKTETAVEFLMNHLQHSGIQKTVVCLDRPVSNSGRLRALILECAQMTGQNVEVLLENDVDRFLYDKDCVATSDAIILDRCRSWYNLGRRILDANLPELKPFRLNI